MSHETFIIVISAACLEIYLLQCLHVNTWPTLHRIIQALLMGPPLGVGILFVYLGFSGRFLFEATLEDYRLYIFIAGAALIFIGIAGLVKTIKP